MKGPESMSGGCRIGWLVARSLATNVISSPVFVERQAR